MKINQKEDFVNIEIDKEDFARVAKGLNFLNYAAIDYIETNGFNEDWHIPSVVDFISEVNNFFIDKAK